MVVQGFRERAGTVLIRGMYMATAVKGINLVGRKGGAGKSRM